jgi:hypothetical protein
MSGNDMTQRQVIERLNIILRPARAAMPAAQMPPRAEPSASGQPGRALRLTARPGVMQQRYRLYRVCGYGVVSAWYYAAKSPSW